MPISPGLSIPSAASPERPLPPLGEVAEITKAARQELRPDTSHDDMVGAKMPRHYAPPARSGGR